MAKTCEICGKSYQRAKLVPRGIGNRVTRRTTTRKKVNIRAKRVNVGGSSVKIYICASCLKRMKFDARKEQKEQKTQKEASSN